MFRSAILPPYLRKTPSLEALYPWLYLKGISTGDFGDALQALLGSDARGLSATTITRLRRCGSRSTRTGQAVIGAPRLCLRLGRRRVLQRSARGHGQQTAVHSGADGRDPGGDSSRSPMASWRELLLDVRHRGLTIDPELAIGDGGGFWGALRKVFPQTREQRCWVHKTANVLNKLSKGVQPKAKAMRHLDGRDAGGGRPRFQWPRLPRSSRPAW